MINKCELIRAGTFGVVVGDAIGVPVEFTSRTERDMDPVTGMREYGTHHQPAGTWSDDSSMMLATMDSMIIRNGFVPEDVMEKFANWLNKGDYTPYGNVFDVGITCSRAIGAFLSGAAPENCGGRGERDNGNGSLMRIMPVSLYLALNNNFWNEEDLDEALGFVWLASSLTHGHPRSWIGCMIYTSICHELIYRNNRVIEDCVQCAVDKTLKVYRGSWEKDDWFDDEFLNELRNDGYKRLRDIPAFKALPREAIQSSGYVVHTLEAAIWCLLNSKSYSECVLQAVNLGDDTDTVGAVAGGLAGIYYGFDSIPQDWLSVIAQKEWIDGLCVDFEKLCQTDSRT